MLLFCVLLLVSLIGESSEQTITAMMAEIHALDGENVTLSYKYDGTNIQSLQWYLQYPGSRPEYVISVFEATKSVVRADSQNLRFNATVNSDKKQVSLEISSAKISDSAVYYCALQPTVTGNTKSLYKNPGANGSVWFRQNEQIFIYFYKDAMPEFAHCGAVSVSLSLAVPAMSLIVHIDKQIQGNLWAMMLQTKDDDEEFKGRFHAELNITSKTDLTIQKSLILLCTIVL
ncbi:uncharacterized protein LOC116219588 [Clupea harengus]|uniref:Uncharacterized protein LOC116219588 n=1 Tax=Clupea harengus TaxID=7950 RepID=A0A6P8F2D5_CLUHA|nr:uncharacterized protein LOC116219588 [Clupea harengus]